MNDSSLSVSEYPHPYRFIQRFIGVQVYRYEYLSVYIHRYASIRLYGQILKYRHISLPAARYAHFQPAETHGRSMPFMAVRRTFPPPEIIVILQPERSPPPARHTTLAATQRQLPGKDNPRISERRPLRISRDDFGSDPYRRPTVASCVFVRQPSVCPTKTLALRGGCGAPKSHRFLINK